MRFPLLTLALIACSPKNPAPGEARPAPQGVAEAAAGQKAPAHVPAPDPREKALATNVTALFEQEHLLRHKIDDKVSEEAFKNYIDTLDAGKMFLLESDRDALAKYKDEIDDELHTGALELAHAGQKKFTARVAVVEKMVDEVLAQPMDFNDQEYVELDPEKLQLAKTDDELKTRWRQRLELEVMERVAGMEARLKPDANKDKDKDKAKGSAAGSSADDDEDEDKTTPISKIPTTPEGREQKARDDLKKTYEGRFARMKHPGQLDAASDVINAVATVLDPHTTYMPPADKANFDIRMSGSLEGIGAVLREKDHNIEIVEIVPGGASARQGGLQTGDLILSVQQQKGDPVDVFDMRIDEVVSMIRGPKGTVVRLRVQKPDGHEQTLAITRDVVVIEETYAKGAILQQKGKPAYGYIHLPSFYGGRGSPRTSGEDVKVLLDEMEKKKVAGVILDIRSNGGGLLSDAIDITGELIDKGPVVQVKDSDGQKEVLSDKHKGTDYDGPMIVLVDRFSASASEILAGALQDYKRAVIVGAGGTHGKGTVQTIADLDRMTSSPVNLGVLKITIQQFFRPSGSSVQLQGVTPDVMLPDPSAYIDSGEKELKHAIPWSQITPAPFETWKQQTYDTKKLSERSAQRVVKSPTLSKIATATALLRERRNDTKVPLQKTAWEKRRADQKAALDAASPDMKKAQPMFTVKPLAESPAPADAPPAGKAGEEKVDGRSSKWKDNLARDPWVDESLNILNDMTTK
ncbi:MAG: carboxy terminal-processing peptidase [Kofleriaceae bacterium]|nr:carboxy terminal-processing peptidase [Kofleriaceae bacterium]